MVTKGAARTPAAVAAHAVAQAWWPGMLARYLSTGRVQRQWHWEPARLQGSVSGACSRQTWVVGVEVAVRSSWQTCVVGVEVAVRSSWQAWVVGVEVAVRSSWQTWVVGVEVAVRSSWETRVVGVEVAGGSSRLVD